MTDRSVNPARFAQEAREFLAGFRTLLMATTSPQGMPEASYAPFVRLDDNCFYVYVSALSRHTGNLEATGSVSVLFIEDERDADQLLARTRLTFDCRAELIERESDQWHGVMDAFATTFGDVIDMIRPLKDFKLFRIRPQGGVYVRGFGQAYRVTGAALDRFKHIRDATQGDDST